MKLEYEKIKQFMEDMGKSKLTEMEIAFPDGTKIKMKKQEEEFITKENESKEKKLENSQNETIDENKKIQEDLKIITSPMVGTFYLKPSPTEEPYVEIGKQIQKGDTVCIIEAMKLMNEIETEFSGKVVEIYAKDGQSVEYGTELFGIK